jgi:hypothetical protein
MSTTTATGILLLVLPVAFNSAFAMLAVRFDYPDVLRKPTTDVLAAFRDGGTALILLWWAFTLTAVLLTPAAVLLAGASHGADPAVLSMGATVGVLASAVQVLGLVRWPFLVPYLANLDNEARISEARREAIDVVFQSLHRYLGIAVGEHLGYLLTGAWTALAATGLIQSEQVPTWLGICGLGIGALLASCSTEFVGRAWQSGRPVAARLTPPAYIAWSLWLMTVGGFLLW